MATSKYINNLLDFLEKEGERILRECEEERTYTHRTRNLYDSYGFGIYLNGVLVRQGYLSASATAKKPRKWYGKEIFGREEIDKYLRSEYSPTKGIDMVVVATMPYAEILEFGMASLKNKYKVISMAHDKLKALSNKIKNSEVYIISKGKINH